MLRARLLAALCCAATVLACFAGASAQPEGVAVSPSGPPPAGPPPPPPGYGLPDGQWVYTSQYGWLWMTYGDQYVYVPPGGAGEPLEFVFVGDAGWTWIAAPWVWGYGPRPYWGRARPDRFAWYRRGDWRTPQRWRYTAAPERGEPSRRGVRPPPGRREAPPRFQGRAQPPRAAESPRAGGRSEAPRERERAGAPPRVREEPGREGGGKERDEGRGREGR